MLFSQQCQWALTLTLRIKTSRQWHQTWHCLQNTHFPSSVAHSPFWLLSSNARWSLHMNVIIASNMASLKTFIKLSVFLVRDSYKESDAFCLITKANNKSHFSFLFFVIQFQWFFFFLCLNCFLLRDLQNCRRSKSVNLGFVLQHQIQCTLLVEVCAWNTK